MAREVCLSYVVFVSSVLISVEKSALEIQLLFMLQAFKIIQIVLAILLMIAILLQQRSSGLGLAFGGEGNVYRSRRGIEKILYYATIVMAASFALVALATVFFSGTSS